ncbi:MAG TPA: phosphatidylglycerophosphatase A [Pyrinomonadaceae bacterium]|jgi:phosphatidylglycerophosphatase A|nr:phosphatidylglycerophosphatase A [Pyrinomonadaceae bacterium]
MSAKESSDEMNPPVEVSSSMVAPNKRSRTVADYLALAIATCGVGYFPIAPGTLGAMVGVGLYLAIWGWLYGILEANAVRGHLNLLYIFTPQMAAMLLVISVVTVAGTWAATRAEKLMQRKDPSAVVIDEVAGQMIALLTGPFWLPTWWSVLSAFILFRLFDIWKPYPIRRFEALESGLGIMADDLVAGIYALIVNSVLVAGYLLIVSARG